MKHHHVPRAGFCPACGELCDGATNVFARAAPVPGSVAVCFYCACVSRYRADLRALGHVRME